MKKIAFIITFILLAVFSSTAGAINIGDSIGKIYSTDILTFIDGAPVRGYALDGKTAIVVEDLARFGFVVGYSDVERSLYAYIKTNTYKHEPYEGIERGKTGQIVGDIYYSDIKTYINGISVPSFTLDGVTAVAIEDIAADVTQEKTSETCMTYKWDAEQRSITLNPIYDNSAKISKFEWYVEDGVLKPFDSNYEVGKYALLPDGAYNYPIHWQTKDGPVVGKAYESAVTAPNQNSTGDKLLKTYKRYIFDWDYEKILQLYSEGKKENKNYEELLSYEKERLAKSGREIQTYENEEAVILTDGNQAVRIYKGVTPEVNYLHERIADSYKVNVIGEKTDFTEISVDSVILNSKGGFTLFGTHGDNYFVMSESTPYYAQKLNSTIGDCYTVGNSYMHISECIITVDGEPAVKTKVLNVPGGPGPTGCVCIDDFLHVINGTASMNGIVLEVTGDDVKRDIGVELVDVTKGSVVETKILSNGFYMTEV